MNNRIPSQPYIQFVQSMATNLVDPATTIRCTDQSKKKGTIHWGPAPSKPSK